MPALPDIDTMARATCLLPLLASSQVAHGSSYVAVFTNNAFITLATTYSKDISICASKEPTAQKLHILCPISELDHLHTPSLTSASSPELVNTTK